MTRVTSDVDVLNDLFTSGWSRSSATCSRDRHHGDDADHGLAAGAGLCRPAADCIVTQWFRRNVRVVSRGARMDRPDQRVPAENITGMSTVQLFAASGSAEPSTRSTAPTAANIDSIFYYAVFYPAIRRLRRWRRQ